MEVGTHAQQKTVVSNKIQAFLQIKSPMKHGKWQVTMASGSIDMGHKMKCKRVNEILPVA